MQWGCRVRNREELEQLGGTGLQTQDSLGITRARLAKQKRNESAMLFNQIKDMEVQQNPDRNPETSKP